MRAKIKNQDDMWDEVRVLLDQGSEISLCTESLVQKLQLNRTRSELPILGIGNNSIEISRGTTQIELKSRHSEFSCIVRVFIIRKITEYTPNIQTTGSDWKEIKKLQLADPEFNNSRRIEVLLGADVYGKILEAGLIQGPERMPTAQKTKFGWVLSGPSSSQTRKSEKDAPYHRSTLHVRQDKELEKILKAFWLQEEHFSYDGEEMSVDEKQCMEHFEKTHRRLSNGTYVVKLPFKKSPQGLGETYGPALQMLKAQEKQFERNAKLQQAYCEFLEEYETMGHMERPKGSTDIREVCYLPHHGVIRESSKTTKLRVVFNGSYRTKSGHCLNEYLHEGPKLLNNLVEILTRWRKYKYVFAADAEKMYRQIQVDKNDRKYQRILWRKDKNKDPVSFELTTVTYGLRPAPFLAVATLKQLEKDEGENFPLASEIISKNCYMDDVLSGGNSTLETMEKIEQTIALFKAGGFPLQKWITNDDVVCSVVRPQDRESALSVKFDKDQIHKALGLAWKNKEDEFTFSLSPEALPEIITKRVVLSKIAQLFDPLGWISPVVVRGKILLQELWSAKLTWDEALPKDMLKKWQDYHDQLKEVSEVSVPRWIGTAPDNIEIQIHGFADASNAALGAVVYLRVTDKHAKIRVTLVTSKSKVAPLKNEKGVHKAKGIKVTTPRLELSAVVMLVKLINQVQKTLELQETIIHVWTDSMITYHWIKGEPTRWKEFVKNRVMLIQETLPQAVWHHLPGPDNPADLASRGMSAKQLSNSNLWWWGPEWLVKPPEDWPEPGKENISEDVDLEERRPVTCLAATTEKSPTVKLMETFSSLKKLVSATAVLLKFARWMKLKSKKALSSDEKWNITAQDLKEAKLSLILFTQKMHFPEEIKQLMKKGSLLSSNSLIRLAPIVDNQRLLRVGSRLQKSQLSQDEIHLIILPRSSLLTTLILQDTHQRTLHGGTQLMLATLRQNYWIVGGRSPVRSFVRKCVKCARYRAIAAQQMMGQLPASRSTPSRPFSHSGVDYAGPFTIKARSGRTKTTYKAYLVVFVCFSTSAVHLELTTDYTTDGFLAAFKRFTSRRGLCQKLYSDCGTNLVGADAELKRLFNSSSKEMKELASLLAKDQVEWNFNPPSAPHFGGKWESAVKSAKYHIKRIMGNSLLTYEQFSTFLTQVEAQLNSRPMCPMTDDPEDLHVLTPGDFLTGAPINAVPEPSLQEVSDARLSKWQLIQKNTQQLWDRWTKEYLQQFHARSKWHQVNSSLQVGSMVLLIDERYPPSKWPLARVLELHQGEDGLVRVATIKTQTTTLIRPIVKLCLLPVSEEARVMLTSLSSRRECFGNR